MSSTEGKAWTRARIEALTRSGPVSVLDVGPGVGTYAKLLAGRSGR
jgi:ubiquinone/menaquinone biosynthesis C-methylase UbiE